MYMRVSRVRGSPERLGEVAGIMRERFIPRLRQATGFVGGYWAGDRDSGRVLAITLWDTEEALRASEVLAEEINGQAPPAFGAALESVERYEVVERA